MPEPEKPRLKAYGIRHRAKQSPNLCFAPYAVCLLYMGSDKHTDT